MLFTRIIVAVFAAFILIGPAQAQTTGKKKYVKPGTEEAKKKEEEDKTSKWGFGVNIGNIAFQTNAFQIGLDPNVAYRLADNVAVGLMVKMNYYHARYYYTSNTTLTYSAFDLGPTIFARWKPLLKTENATPFMQGVFLQAEFERSYVNREAVDEFGNLILNDDGTKIETEINKEHYLYLGIGFASGYPFSSFVSFHYNILDNAELSRYPFTYRIGFTWNY